MFALYRIRNRISELGNGNCLGKRAKTSLNGQYAKDPEKNS